MLCSCDSVKLRKIIQHIWSLWTQTDKVYGQKPGRAQCGADGHNLKKLRWDKKKLKGHMSEWAVDCMNKLCDQLDAILGHIWGKWELRKVISLRGRGKCKTAIFLGFFIFVSCFYSVFLYFTFFVFCLHAS